MAATHFALVLLGLAISPMAVMALPFVPQQFASAEEALCFSNAHQFFAINKQNIKRITCPFLSSMIHEGRLPTKKFYTKDELEQASLAAGVVSSHAPHIKAVFNFNAPALMDIFNMEGNPNEHNASTGINDCENIYPCDDGIHVDLPGTVCRHNPYIIGRQTPFPIPVPNLNDVKFGPLDKNIVDYPEFFCPDIVDHLPKCLQTSICNCTIPNKDKFDEFWNAVDLNKDGLLVASELDVLQGHYDRPTPQSPTVWSVDLNPIGTTAGDIAGAHKLLIEAFGTMQVTGKPPGTKTELALSRAQLHSLSIDRMFPVGYTFTEDPKLLCYIDPNEALNQNDYATVASVSKAWTLSGAEAFPADSQAKCKDRETGLSQLTGEIFFGKGAISTILRGTGTGYLDFGNCGNQGSVSVLLHQTSIKVAPHTTSSTIVQFDFTDGEELKLLPTQGGVVRLNFIGVKTKDLACPPTQPVQPTDPCGTPQPSSPCTLQRLSAAQDLDIQQEKANEAFDLQLGLIALLAMGTLGAVVAVAWSRRNSRSTQAMSIDETGTYLQVTGGALMSRDDEEKVAE